MQYFLGRVGCLMIMLLLCITRAARPQVVSTLMSKTCMVAINYYKYVKKYKLWYRRTTKLMAHDEHEKCKVGDWVRIRHFRPLSTRKNFVVMEIVKPEHQYDPEKAKALAEEFEEQARQRTRLHGLDMGFAANVISPSHRFGPASWEPLPESAQLELEQHIRDNQYKADKK